MDDIAKIDYNSTKKAYFYEIKIHMIVTKTGFPIAYSTTSPTIHDIKVLKTLSEEALLPNILGDQGYISRKTQEKIALKSITVSVLPRKNIDTSGKVDSRLLNKQGRSIETAFSSLEKLGCQNFNLRSVQGLESKFESILFAYSILLMRAQQRLKDNLRYSLGY